MTAVADGDAAAAVMVPDAPAHPRTHQNASMRMHSSSSSGSSLPGTDSTATASSTSGVYRELVRFVDSSSPAKDREGFRMHLTQASDPVSTSSLPVTPPSSPPQLPRWMSPTSQANFIRAASNADPFSASAKAPSISSHPSFSKQYPHVKHPHPSSASPQKKLAGKKRALEASPQQQSPARMGDVRQLVDADDGLPGAAASTLQSVLGSKPAGALPVGASEALRNRADIFGSFFQDSDGAGTSSDDGEFDFARGIFINAASSSVAGDDAERTTAGLSGLGLGQDMALSDNVPPSSPQGLRASPMLEKGRRFSRNNSHPYEAFGPMGAPSSPPAARMQSSLVGSPGSRAPATRRARFIGSSPTQLTVQRWSRFPPDGAISDADEDEGGDDTVTDDLFARKFADARQPLRPWERYESLPVSLTTDIVQRAVSKAFDTAKPIVDLSGRELEYLTPAIAELGDWVGVAPNPVSTDRSKMFSRTPTADTPGLANGSAQPARDSPATAAGRTLASPPRSLSHPSSQSSHSLFAGASATQLFLANNALRALPSALFAVQNLSVLSLRKNGLRELPAAIGSLHNLRELNVGDNELPHLPAEILRLRLSTFTYHPNPFKRPPAGSRLAVRPLRGLLSHAAASESHASTESTPASTQDAGLLPASQQAAQELGAAPARSPLQMPDFASYAGSTTAASALPPADAALPPSQRGAATRKRKRLGRASLLSQLETHHQGIPTLRDLCTRRLLGPADADEAEDEEAMRKRRKRRTMLLETFENGTLRQMSQQGMLSENSLRQLESARRSAMKLWNSRPDLAISSPRPAKMLGASSGGVDGARFFSKRQFRTWCSGADVFNAAGLNHTVASSDIVASMTSAGDNAKDNPWFNRCPNPAHIHPTLRSRGLRDDEDVLDWPTDTALPEDTSPLYLNPAETRIEWVSHIGGLKVASSSVQCELPASTGADTQQQEPILGPLAEHSGCLPILWRGCKRGCLDFLT